MFHQPTPFFNFVKEKKKQLSYHEKNSITLVVNERLFCSNTLDVGS